jgi:hypothetical protein
MEQQELNNQEEEELVTDADSKDKKVLDFLNNEEKINDILFKIRFEEPKSPFYCYLREKIKENVENKDMKKYEDDYNHLSESKMKVYEIQYEKEVNEYLRDLGAMPT